MIETEKNKDHNMWHLLENNSVAHDKSRNQRGVGFVERIVVRRADLHNAEWRALDLRHHTANHLYKILFIWHERIQKRKKKKKYK